MGLHQPSRRTTRQDRANLSAGSLGSFGFAVEAAIGRRPMRYLIGRRFTGDTALTCLFVTQPETLAGTHVRISEDRRRGACEVQTYVPTMRCSLRLAERYLFGCLPLTEVGYLDLMAWRYPGLGSTPEDRDSDLSWSGWPGAEAYCFLGPASTPGLTVTEAVDPASGIVVARAVDRRREPERRWEVVELGDPSVTGLPRLIRAGRPGRGSPDAGCARAGVSGGERPGAERWTDFRRVGEPAAVPAADFDGGPQRLREALEHRFPARPDGPA
ncbi:hypothetical protein [Actinomadura xylanilytica]|uniref:hypothetical protein n=1 Tax=Actinomadura xylanilytica TaxID=887459 RepID=UPI00255AC267|nr:hypothetical protein [Actinomadura xylanilytica]MDL4776719.1 hypothetical protein [Actinomadura xylanilytica]